MNRESLSINRVQNLNLIKSGGPDLGQVRFEPLKLLHIFITAQLFNEIDPADGIFRNKLTDDYEKRECRRYLQERGDAKIEKDSAF